MSESLTTIEGLEKKYAGTKAHVVVYRTDLNILHAMARRCLSAEERLERGVKAAFYEGCQFGGAFNFPYSAAESCWEDSESKKFLDGPKAIRPRVPCAPPAVTDVPPPDAMWYTDP